MISKQRHKAQNILFIEIFVDFI